jgi:kynurenine formamidase
MARRIIDLSVPLQSDIASDPPGHEPKLTYIDHHQSASQVCSLFPGLTPADLPDGEGWAIERIDLSTHNGTHLDAPYHVASTMDGGRPALRIDEVPLAWCSSRRHFPNGYVATAADVETELKRIGHEVRPLDIVVVNTSAGQRYGEPNYVATGCGMGREATLLPHLARCQDHRHRRLVLGCPIRLHGQEIRRDPQCQADLGRSQGGT